MSGGEREQVVYEIALVIPKLSETPEKQEHESCECVDFLVDELRSSGFAVDRVVGLTDEFIKLGAPWETLGKAAVQLQMRKPTHIGMDLPFELDEAKAFMRQPDGSLFSWCERFQCYQQLIYAIVNKGKCDVKLRYKGRGFRWQMGESLVRRLESEGVIKQVFPIHDEIKRKKLLRSWALKWWDFANQPIDEIYSYFGSKIGIYFSFLGMYTRWMIFPAILGLVSQLVDFRSLQVLVLPIFLISITLWAVLFLQFWKRKNAALLARWQINYLVSTSQALKYPGIEWNSLQSPSELVKKLGYEKIKEKEAYQRYEWLAYFQRLRNDALVIISIVCLQLPFELAYAHLYEVIDFDAMKFALTGIYLLMIRYLTQFGGRVSVRLIQRENNETAEYRADSLIYKVFGLYFMQSYIGIFYHVLLHKDFLTLRQVLIQRMVLSEVLGALMESSLPYLKYSYRKYIVRNKKRKENKSLRWKIPITTRVEKEYYKPAYSASVGDELEDGLFDDFLKLALQFGMIMMFACAFPLAFAFAAVRNVMEIRATALKLLATLRRPVPRAFATIGAWLNIFQFLIVMSICTNSALLVCLYDQEGKWTVEPGLAAILIMEHILLLLKFGLSRLIPEEPAWVRASRVRNATQAQDVFSKQLLRSISKGEQQHLLGKQE